LGSQNSVLETSEWEFEELTIEQFESLVIIFRPVHDFPNIIDVIFSLPDFHGHAVRHNSLPFILERA